MVAGFGVALLLGGLGLNGLLATCAWASRLPADSRSRARISRASAVVSEELRRTAPWILAVLALVVRFAAVRRLRPGRTSAGSASADAGTSVVMASWTGASAVAVGLGRRRSALGGSCCGCGFLGLDKRLGLATATVRAQSRIDNGNFAGLDRRSGLNGRCALPCRGTDRSLSGLGVTCSATCSALAAVRRRVRAAGFSADCSAAGASGVTGAASSVNAAASRSAARRRARTTWASLICASARACATSSEMGAEEHQRWNGALRARRTTLGLLASSPSAAGLAKRRVRLGLAGAASSLATGARWARQPQAPREPRLAPGAERRPGPT